MRLEHTHHREPAAIGNSQETHASVVFWHIFHQPIDGVVSICTFIDGFCVFRIAHRPLHDEFAFRAVASANILKHEDVAFGNQFGIAVEDAAVTFGIVAKTIRGALEDNGQGLGCVLGRIDFCVQLHAVARRDHDLRFIEELRVVGPLLLRGRPERKQKDA